MEYLRIFEDHFKVRGIGIRLANKVTNPGKFKEVKMVSFCEAVNLARKGPLILKKGNLSCPGARYAFGLHDVNHKIIINGLMQERGLTSVAAEKLIRNMPRLSQLFEWIILDDKNSHIYLFCFNPKKFMDFLALSEEGRSFCYQVLCQCAVMWQYGR